MKIDLFKRPKNKTTGVFVVCTPDEALRLAASLVAQVQKSESNVARVEFTDFPAKHKFTYFSVAVQEEMTCVICRREIEPCTGRRIEGGILCEKCQERGCPVCKSGPPHRMGCSPEMQAAYESIHKGK